MKKTLLLLAGSPGTGKSYFDNWIRKEIPDYFHETSIDVFKEKQYEEVGFDNPEERATLDNKAYEMFYDDVERFMNSGKSIISDYPFSYRQHDTLKKLAKKYGYQIITITLTADPDVLYERQKNRNLDPSRNLGFILPHYHKGDVVKDRSKIKVSLSRSEFDAFNKKRNYAGFKLGKTIVLDVSDFKTADYEGTIAKIKQWIN